MTGDDIPDNKWWALSGFLLQIIIQTYSSPISTTGSNDSEACQRTYTASTEPTDSTPAYSPSDHGSPADTDPFGNHVAPHTPYPTPSPTSSNSIHSEVEDGCPYGQPKCTGLDACDKVTDRSKIGCGSCNAENACEELGADVTVGTNSCNGDENGENCRYATGE